MHISSLRVVYITALYQSTLFLLHTTLHPKAMSISIDDLVSSFSSSHIGQEANDLAALQAQLAQTLFAASSSSFASSSRFQSSPIPQGAREPCTTPTPRSPVQSSFSSWGEIDRPAYRSRSSSISLSNSGYEDTEDEMMVEGLLLPASASTSAASENNHSIPFMQRTPSHSYHQRTPSMSYDSAPPASPFTSSDPFYLQAQAHAQSYFYDNSNITQHGRPGMSSPFVAAAANQFGGYQQYASMGVAS
ncbi:hypothetical protein D9611_007560 [Ephemerocybe angulata]|uniref:Uncharacterized protein n=1 Tax=Ephemerocybe angulata TaxID=980116 RepID=A0A8H5C056_9AGAR|nr:hypothetical protein D9611_007560 [Tulosesus angulatus]